MKRLHPGTLVLTLFLLLFSFGRLCAQSQSDLGRIAYSLMQALQSSHPAPSTAMGIHLYDNMLADYSSKSVKSRVKVLKRLRRDLGKVKPGDLSERDFVTYQLLHSNVEAGLLRLEQLEVYRHSPGLYVDEAINGIRSLIVADDISMDERLPDLIKRMEEVPVLLRTARKNLKDVPAEFIEPAHEAIERAIDLYRVVASEIMNRYPDSADEVLKVSTQAREALNDFDAYLAQLKPADSGQFALGGKTYSQLLRTDYLLTAGTDSLLALGMAMLEDAEAAYRTFELEVELDHQDGQDSVFVPASFTAADIVDYYNWEVEQVRLFVEREGIVTVPEGVAPITVATMPDYLRPVMNGIVYKPAPAFVDHAEGRLFVRPITDEGDRRQVEALFRFAHRRGFRGTVVQDCFPGRHLQVQLASMNADPVRKWQVNPMMIEGWSLYSQEMMYESGLFGDDPIEWLRILNLIRRHTAFMVADIKLHTAGMSIDECVAWLQEKLGEETSMSRSLLRRRVLDMAANPGRAIAPAFGRKEIIDLREEFRERVGAGNDQRDFHDALLAEGSIPPVLLRGLLSDGDLRP